MRPSQVKEAVHVEQRGSDTRVVIIITPGGARGQTGAGGGLTFLHYYFFYKLKTLPPVSQSALPFFTEPVNCYLWVNLMDLKSSGNEGTVMKVISCRRAATITSVQH